MKRLLATPVGLPKDIDPAFVTGGLRLEGWIEPAGAQAHAGRGEAYRGKPFHQIGPLRAPERPIRVRLGNFRYSSQFFT